MKLFLLLIVVPLIFPPFAIAQTLDLQAPNNKFGIHIISPTESEVKNAAQFVNSSGGDWGYVTVVIQRNDQNRDKWQNFFDLLRRYHLIPIVRIATETRDGYWVRPDANDANHWADFLSGLNWPTKRRFVVVYNEPNQGKEWGNSSDPASYARILDQTITALKGRSSDFFVMNAGFDESAPQNTPFYYDEEKFLEKMDSTVPGIFEKLDGWVSHSYPNPDFSGKPADSGRGTIRGYEWELTLLTKLGVKKYLPVFITETGWKHREGVVDDPSFLSAGTVAEYFRTAFESVWGSEQVVAVTPFVLDYPQPPFDHFSLRKVLGSTSEFLLPYKTISGLLKNSGLPTQDRKARFESESLNLGLIEGNEYRVPITVKNVGQVIWGERGRVELVPSNVPGLETSHAALPQGTFVEPGQSYTFELVIFAEKAGNYEIKIDFTGDRFLYEGGEISIRTKVKSKNTIVRFAENLWGRFLE